MTAPPDRAAPPRRRRSAADPVAAAAVVAIAAATVLASCDTGDGKTLKPPAVEFTTTVAPPATLLSVPLDTSDVGTVPLSAAPATERAADAPSAFQAFAPWQDGAAIDQRYTCDGDDISPAVSWTTPPAGTAELAIALVDESATDGDGPFVHWVVAGVDPSELSLLEADIPTGAVEAVNSFGSTGYSGPCPPPGDEPHQYRLTVYALNQQSELADGTPATNLLDFIEVVAIGAASLTGTAVR